MAHHGSVTLVVLALAALAAAQPIKETVSNCSAMLAAFNKLSTQFADATTPTPLSLTLTLNCSADWSSCTDSMEFWPSGPAKSPKQPPIKITITAKCNKGKNVTIPTAKTFLRIESAATSAKVDVRVEKLIVTGGSAVRFTAAKNSKSTLKTKDLSVRNGTYAIDARFLDSVSVVGGRFESNEETDIIFLDGVNKSASITKATFNDYEAGPISLIMYPNSRVTLTGNTFKNARVPTDTAIYVRYTDAKINVNLAKMTFDNTSSVPICIRSESGVTPATVSVSGLVGVSPTKMNRALKPAGWPTSLACEVAEFAAA